MNIGDKVVWTDQNGFDRVCEIIKVNKNKKELSYDILLPERNILFESVLNTNYNSILKGDKIKYKNKDAVVTKIDWSSNSLQIRIIERHVT